MLKVGPGRCDSCGLHAKYECVDCEIELCEECAKKHEYTCRTPLERIERIGWVRESKEMR